MIHVTSSIEFPSRTYVDFRTNEDNGVH